MFPILVTTCSSLTAPDDGDIDCNLGGDGEANPGDTCTFTCDDGFGVIGSGSRTCMADRSWSDTQPRCSQGVSGIAYTYENTTTLQ